MAKFTEEDDNLIAELGIGYEVKKKPTLSARDERIIAGFEEIQKFVEENNRQPSFDHENDIFERLYATRLEQIRKQSDCIELLKDLDHQDLLNDSYTTNIIDEDDLEKKYKKILEHPLYKFVNNICRWGNFNCIRILNRMTIPTDETDIYNSFNISQKEIEFITSI